MFTTVFYEIAALLAVAAIIGAIALQLRQPLIVAYIVVGILVGPSGLGWVSADAEVDLLAKIGIALLLFMVGLKLDLHLIRTLGPVALATGLGQVIFTSLIGFLIAMGLGLSVVESLYVAVALTFSSTIIIVKLLSDKREIDALHGRIAVGFLIVQDLVVILVMIGLTALSPGEQQDALGLTVGVILLKGVALLGLIALLMRYVLPGLLDRLARSRELLVLFAIAWAVLLATVGDMLGFSKEVGAFLAGMALASTPYREAIGARLVSLRDFLLLFFFINLSAGLELGLLGEQVIPALVLSVFVLLGNPLIVMVIMGLMGYRKRTGFLAGLTVAQISEFSLLFGALGLSLGHIQTPILGLITLVGLITIGLSTYMILYSGQLYEWLASWLGPFERRVPHREEAIISEGIAGTASEPDVILFGLGRYGGNIAHELRRRGWRVLAVDFDPEAVKRWRHAGFPVHYGDAEDPEFPAALPLQGVRWVISAIPQIDVNLTLLHGLSQHDYRGRIAVTAHDTRDAQRLKRAGLHVVLLPFHDAAKEAADIITAATADEGTVR
jgi:Kef-type K+ transport system membrane component KefB